MTTIYTGDMDDLRRDGWEVGAYWSLPGVSGYYLRHDVHAPEWVQVRVTPCEDDSMSDDEGYVGPSGAADSATEAMLDRLSE